MSRPERRRIHLQLVALCAGAVIGYIAIAGPVVYMGARGWLPDVLYDAFCLPLWWMFATPAWGIVGGYLEWWWQMAERPAGTLAYDKDLRIAIAIFVLIAICVVARWIRSRPELRSGRCAGCGTTVQVRSFRVYSPACPKCGTHSVGAG